MGVAPNVVFLTFLTNGTPFVKGLDLAPELKSRLLRIKKSKSLSAPLQNRLLEIGARCQFASLHLIISLPL